MATTTITGRTAVTAGNLTGAAVFPVDDANGNTRKATLAQLRTNLLAGGTGFTASDPVVCGTLQTSGIAGFGQAPEASNAVAARGATSDATSNVFLGRNAAAVVKFAVDSTGAVTAATGAFALNQNATTVVSVTNTDGTNAASRAELRVVGNAISGIMSSIATDALYIGASTNSVVRFISNGAEKFRLNTDGTVTFGSAITATSYSTTSGSGTFTNATATTVFTPSVKGTYLVSVTNSGGGVAANGWAAVGVDGAGNVAILTQGSGGSGSFTLVGTTLKYTQSTGVSQTLSWTYTVLA